MDTFWAIVVMLIIFGGIWTAGGALDSILKMLFGSGGRGRRGRGGGKKWW